MTDEQKTRVVKYVTTLNSDIPEGDLLDLLVDTVADRVLLYLNETELNTNLERVVAQVVVATYIDTGAVHDQTIAEVEDNGQVVRYHQTPVQYYASKTDQELFAGFEKLLQPYRRIHVIAN